MKKKTFRSKVSRLTSNFAYWLEVLASLLVLISSAVMLFNIFLDIVQTGKFLHLNVDHFNDLLGDMLVITVGLEFVKLLTSRRFYDLIEVLMLATSRQMIVEHFSMLQMLTGIGAIGLLYVIRKYLATAADIADEREERALFKFGKTSRPLKNIKLRKKERPEKEESE
jgi:uncharacterized membrane protein (DUF373 family)